MNNTFKPLFILFLVGFSFMACESKGQSSATSKVRSQAQSSDKIIKSEKKWKQELSPLAFHVLRKKGTETAFTGKYDNFKEEGIFVCAGCGNPLFSSRTKYDSGSGWPSFYAPIQDKNIIEEMDNSFAMVRAEVLCSRCDGHLGHVFEDGPQPTGLRYCINSAALNFVKE